MPSHTVEISVSDILSVCAGAYSTRTVAGYSSDLRIFVSWCASRSLTWLPASPAALAEFINEQVESHCLSTIKRRLCAIAFAHRIRELPLPTEHGIVRLAVRRAARHRPSRLKQVRGLTQAIRAKIVARFSPTLAGLRDAALISIGYDTLCRSSELAAMNVGHVRFEGDGTATVIIPRSKSDATGTGRVAYLAPETSALLARWLEEANLWDGPLFRALHLSRPSEGPLVTSSIRRIIKRASARSGLPAPISNELSGHSMRIGAAQDMMIAGFDALAIMHAGGWRSANVVLRYVENAATRELHERRWERLQQSR